MHSNNILIYLLWNLKLNFFMQVDELQQIYEYKTNFYKIYKD